MKIDTTQSLVKSLGAFADRSAVGVQSSYGARWWSYQELSEHVVHAAGSLRDQGLERGDKLVLWSPNCPETVAFLLAAALRGLVAVPLDDSLTPSAVSRVVDMTGARLLVCAPELADLLPGVAKISLYAPHARAEAGHRDSLDAVLVPVEPDDPAVILFTSGTTARAKGVILTHGNIAAQLNRFARWRRPSRLYQVGMLNLCPLSHSLGLVIGLYLPLLLGLKLLFSKEVSPVHVMRTIREGRLRILLTVPRLQRLLIDALLKHPIDHSGSSLIDRLELEEPQWWQDAPWWRRLTSRRLVSRARRRYLGWRFRWVFVGGAAIARRDETFWFLARCFLIQGYGLTETAALVSLQVNSPFHRKPGAVGRPLPDQEIRIAEDGELSVAGPHVAECYVTPSGAVTRRERGQFSTGDLVRVDQGRFHVVGRKSDMIVTGDGNNIQPAELEDLLRAQPQIVDAVVLARERDREEMLHAVLLADEESALGDAMRRVNAELESWQRISSWSLWTQADFPRNRSLKVDRRALSALLDRAPANCPPSEASSPRLSLQQILDIEDQRLRLQRLAEYISDPTAGPGRTDEATLELVSDLGLSSLDLVELTGLLERRCGHDLEDLTLSEGTRLSDLSARLASPSRGKAAGPDGRIKRSNPDHPALRLARGSLGSLIFSTAALLGKRVEIQGGQSLDKLDPPVFLLASCQVDFSPGLLSAIRQSLPPAWRRGLLILTNRKDYAEAYIKSQTSMSRRRKLIVEALSHMMQGLVSYSGLPHFGSTRAALMETARLVQRGYSPLLLRQGLAYGPGTLSGFLTIAQQTQMPIVPMHVSLKTDGDGTPRSAPRSWCVAFGEIVHPRPDLTEAEVDAKLIGALTRLHAQSTNTDRWDRPG